MRLSSSETVTDVGQQAGIDRDIRDETVGGNETGNEHVTGPPTYEEYMTDHTVLSANRHLQSDVSRHLPLNSVNLEESDVAIEITAL